MSIQLDHRIIKLIKHVLRMKTIKKKTKKQKKFNGFIARDCQTLRAFEKFRMLTCRFPTTASGCLGRSALFIHLIALFSHTFPLNYRETSCFCAHDQSQMISLYYVIFFISTCMLIVIDTDTVISSVCSINSV